MPTGMILIEHQKIRKKMPLKFIDKQLDVNLVQIWIKFIRLGYKKLQKKIKSNLNQALSIKKFKNLRLPNKNLLNSFEIVVLLKIKLWTYFIKNSKWMNGLKSQ